MTDLTDAIDAFLEKYPDDAPLEWQRTTAKQRRKTSPQMQTAIADLVAAGERWKARDRPCLVCEQPCRTEGQLCRTCGDQGHYVTDDSVYVQIDVTLPAPFEPDDETPETESGSAA